MFRRMLIFKEYLKHIYLGAMSEFFAVAGVGHAKPYAHNRITTPSALPRLAVSSTTGYLVVVTCVTKNNNAQSCDSLKW